MTRYKFPDNFLWGVASASYQIEGAYNEDGRGESIWDRFTHNPNNNKISGDETCDHYHRYEEDVRLLKELGVNTYRFSIAWPRIFPNGRGKVNQKGIDFYRRLIDLLVENDIEPLVTLYHWDLPQKLQDIGGWANRDVTDYFEDYARLMFSEFGDKVKHWITHNEPWVVAFKGYAHNNEGTFAPGVKDFSTALLVTHNLLLSHGKAVRAYREMGLDGEIGITLCWQPAYPISDSQEDKDAAERDNRSHHAWFAEPIVKGSYPQDIWKWYESRNVVLPEIVDGDMNIINTPIDFLGLNYYFTRRVKNAPEGFWPLEFDYVTTDNQAMLMKRGDPDGLYKLLKRLDREYGLKIIITENGQSNLDVVNRNGEVIDDSRIEYLYDHIMACYRAIQDGVNLSGYNIWSFMDDYEWGRYGRLGLVYVDYKTKQRVIKKSGYWYKQVVENNGL